MPLGTELDLDAGHIVLDEDPAPSPSRKWHMQQPPLFGPCLSWPNGRPSQQLLSTCSYLHLFCVVRRCSVFWPPTCHERQLSSVQFTTDCSCSNVCSRTGRPSTSCWSLSLLSRLLSRSSQQRWRAAPSAPAASTLPRYTRLSLSLHPRLLLLLIV